MDDDTAAADSHRIGRVDILWCTHPIIIDGDAILRDLYPKLVDTSAARRLAIVSGKHKPVAWNTVDVTSAFVLCFMARNDERAEVVRRTMKVDVSSFELELGLTLRCK